jgi:conjugal transfer pilus assembly protein TraE
VPPSINKTFWVTRDKASSEYLEQMGSFIAWLVLDVTPASIDWKKDILLGYVEPDQYGPLKTRQEVEAERLKRINAATVFAPQQLVPSEKARASSSAAACAPWSTASRPPTTSRPTGRFSYAAAACI